MKRFFKCLIAIGLPLLVFSQVGINTVTPDASAALDVNSQMMMNFGGLKIPVVATNIERNEIVVSGNDSGVLIFNQESDCIEVFDAENNNWVTFDYCNVTIFEEGDFMFTGVYSDNPDEFSIIPLKNVASGQRFYITDCGILADGTSFRQNEGLMYWDVTVPILARTEITFTSDGSNNWTSTSGTVTVFEDTSNLYGTFFQDIGPQLTTDGDQIIFFTTTDDNDPLNNVNNFVTALSLESGWDVGGATNTSTSAIPNGLTQGINASTLTTSGDNKSLRCDISFPSMDDITLRAYISNTSNWDHDDIRTNINVPSGCAFN